MLLPELPESAPCPVIFRVSFFHLVPEGKKFLPGKTVQNIPVIFRTEQCSIVVLSVNIDQNRRDRGKYGKIDDPAVDTGDTFAGSVDISGKDEIFIGGVQSVVTVFGYRDAAPRR